MFDKICKVIVIVLLLFIAYSINLLVVDKVPMYLPTLSDRTRSLLESIKF